MLFGIIFMDNQDHIIGAYVRHLREEAESLTLREFAGMVGLSYQRVSAIENGLIGKRKTKILNGILEHFGKSVEELTREAQEWHDKKTGVNTLNAEKYIEAKRSNELGPLLLQGEQTMLLMKLMNEKMDTIIEKLQSLDQGCE